MKTVVITGVSRGIGKATAQKFLEEGWDVIGTSTSGRSPLQHPHLRMHRLDLADYDSIARFSGELGAKKDHIDVLINNAGTADLSSDKAPISGSVLRRTLDVNLIGTIALTEALLPLVRDGGRIVNLSSGLASLSEDGGEGLPAYRISKVGLNMFTRHLAGSLRSRRIVVSSFDPGWVQTDMGTMEAPRTPSEPAAELFDLATAAAFSESGCFWHGGRKRSW